MAHASQANTDKVDAHLRKKDYPNHRALIFSYVDAAESHKTE
ncbi:MAG: hypothetical protein JWM49_2121 [Microbacteriaceae bacterium]|nr:hypothetical protein [Microbacteriaceae bacterium]